MPSRISRSVTPRTAEETAAGDKWTELLAPKPGTYRLAAPYQSFRAADGYINVGAANQANWEKLVVMLERPDLLADARYSDNPSRTRHAAELAAELDVIFAQRPAAEWLARLEAAGVPAGPIYDLAAAYAQPQVPARDMVVELDHPTAGRVKHIGVPVKLSETPGVIGRPAPTLGQHTDEILAEAGLGPEVVASLRSAGVVL